MKLHEVLSHLLTKRLQNDDVQDFDTRWDHALLQKWSWMVYTSQNCRILYEQENIRNNDQPSYSGLKRSVRRHIDQTMRTRNLRAQSELVERGAVTKSHQRKKAHFDGKVVECYQWKAIGQCSKGDSCSFSHDHQKRRHGLTGRYHPKVQEAEGRAFWKQREDSVPKFC